MSKARDLGDAANKANFLDNVTSDIQGQINAVAGMPSGAIMTFGGSTAPTGYLACDGSAVSRTTYATLFTAIGTTWGTGNGFSTFNLPDLRGAFLRGTGSHGTQNMANGNDFAGQAVGSFENDQFQGFKARIFSHGAGNAGGNKGLMKSDDNDGSNSAHFDSIVSDGTNGTPRVGDETRPFNAGILYCIKT